MKTLGRSQLVKEMIKQPVVYWIIPISEIIMRWWQQIIDNKHLMLIWKQHKISFTTNLDRDGNTTFFIIEEAKETLLDFSQGTVKVL